MFEGGFRHLGEIYRLVEAQAVSHRIIVVRAAGEQHIQLQRVKRSRRWSRSPATRDASRFALGIPVVARAKALAALDSLEAARSAVVEFRALPHPNPRTISRARWVTSEIELAAGNPERALVILNEIDRRGMPRLAGLDNIEWREALARAHRMAGRLDEAAKVHEEMLRVFRSHSLSHYDLGQIYEEMGRAADAEREYTAFLSAWAEADDGLPQVEDAQQRLGALRATGN